MTDDRRFIEVIASARTVRTVEAYEAEIELSVSSRRRQPCLQASIELREEVLAALSRSGITESDIQEGGGQFTQLLWSASRSVSHRMLIRSSEMEKLIRAMAAVEQLFVDQKQSFFSPVRRSFWIRTPVPQYASEDDAESTVRKAVDSARAIAEALAAGAGKALGDISCIVECSPSVRRRSAGLRSEEFDWSGTSDFLADSDEPGEAHYTSVSQPTHSSRRVFRVRFVLEGDRERVPSEDTTATSPTGGPS